MENSLALLDGSILLVGLIGIILGWFLRWIVSRQSAKQLLLQTKTEIETKTANVEALQHDLNHRDRTIGEQSDKLEELASERETLTQKIQTQETGINELTAKIELLDSSQSENGEALEILEDTVASLEERLSSEKAKQEKLIAEYAQQINALESSELSLGEQLNEKNQINSRLTTELEAAHEALQHMELEVTEKTEALEKRVAPANQLRDELAQTAQLRAKDQGEISSLRSSLTIWQNRAVKAESHLEKSQEKLQEIEAQQESLGKPDLSYEKLLTLKEQEISAQKKQTHDAQARLVSVRDEITARETEIGRLKEALQKQQNQSNREVASISRKLEEHKSSASELTAELEGKNKTLQQQLDNLTAEKASISRRLTDASAEITALNEGNKSLRNEVDNLQGQARIGRDEISKLVVLNNKLETQTSEAETESVSAKRNLENARRELQAKVNANDSLRQELVKCESAHQQLDNALRDCQAQLQNLLEQQTTHNKAPSFLSKKPTRVDDLKKIKGIGPVLEKILNDLGIYHFAQIAGLREEEITWVDEHIETFKGRIYRDEWVKQAKKLSTD